MSLVRELKIRDDSEWVPIHPKTDASAVEGLGAALDSYKENFIDPELENIKLIPDGTTILKDANGVISANVSGTADVPIMTKDIPGIARAGDGLLMEGDTVYVDPSYIGSAEGSGESRLTSPQTYNTSNLSLLARIEVSRTTIGKSFVFPINPDRPARVIVKVNSNFWTSVNGKMGLVFNGAYQTFTLYDRKQTAASAATTITNTSYCPNIPLELTLGLATPESGTFEINYVPDIPIHIKGILGARVNNNTNAIRDIYGSITRLTQIELRIPSNITMSANREGLVEIYKEQDITPVSVSSLKQIFYENVVVPAKVEVTVDLYEDIDNIIIESNQPEKISISGIFDTGGYPSILNSFTSSATRLQVSSKHLASDGVIRDIENYRKPKSIIIYTAEDFTGILRVSKEIPTHSIATTPDVLNGLEVSLTEGMITIAPGNIEIEGIIYNLDAPITKPFVDMFLTEEEAAYRDEVYIYAKYDVVSRPYMTFIAVPHSAPNMDRFGNKYDSIDDISPSLGKYVRLGGSIYRAIAKVVYINDTPIVAVPSYRPGYDITLNINAPEVPGLQPTNNPRDKTDTDHALTPADFWSIIRDNDTRTWDFVAAPGQTEFELGGVLMSPASKDYLVIVGGLALPPTKYTIQGTKMVFDGDSAAPEGVFVSIRTFTGGFTIPEGIRLAIVGAKQYLYRTMGAF